MERKAALEDYLLLEYIKKQKKARKNLDDFQELILTNDKTGVKIKQEDLHKSWTEHINNCKQQGKHCAILAPWGHGKTVQVIGFILRCIGENKNIRIKLINSLDMYAVDRIRVIKNHIESNEDFKALYPDIQEDITQQWTGHRIYVKRDSNAIDPTIEARGITAKGVGGRADILVFDDPVDDESIHSESIRNTVREKYQNLWMPRLVDNGFVLYIATRWASEDLTQTIINSGRFSVLVQRISEDFSCIEQEII